MSSERLFGAALLSLVALGCGGSDPTGTPDPQLGAILLSIATTGHDVDPDGYRITIDQQPAYFFKSNDSLMIYGEAAGTHSVVLSGSAPNCRSESARINAVVTPGGTAQAAFQIHCFRTQLHNEIVFSTEGQSPVQLLVMNPDGSEPEVITFDGQDYFQPSVSPDGRRIAFLYDNNGTWKIGIVNVDGTNRHTLPTPGHYDAEPVWSPDGSAIAFRSELSGPSGDYGRIFIINADGSGLRQVSPEVASTDYKFDDAPSWSPNGLKLVFSRDGGGYTINVDGTGLTALDFGCAFPAWSPDASRIACTATVADNLDIYLIDANGANPFRLTTAADQDENARWSPDGTQLVFMRPINSKYQIFRINRDGTGEQQLTRPENDQINPWWAW